MRDMRSKEPVSLRKKAEERLKMKHAEKSIPLTDASMLKLLHELEVHQVELEMQNEELQLAISQAQIATDKYASLYDFAPAGYFTLDPEGKICELNLGGARLLGKDRSHLTGIGFRQFVSRESLDGFNDFLRKIVETHLKASCEVTLTGTGNTPCLVIMEGILTEDDQNCSVTVLDITARKLAEEKISLLLKEIHHRVKNNLAIVISLVEMQSRKSTNPEFIRLSHDIESRIRSMSMIHDHLSKSGDLDKIHFDHYLNSLASTIANCYDRNRIKLNIQCAQAEVPLETAIPLGLIANEILTNSFKYAFPGDLAGEIHVELTAPESEKGLFWLTIRDTGIGLPQDYLMEDHGSLGMMIIRLLVQQIEGELIMESHKGTLVRIIFRIT